MRLPVKPAGPAGRTIVQSGRAGGMVVPSSRDRYPEGRGDDRLMTAGMPSFRHFALIALGLAPLVGAGCRASAKHERNRILQLGVIEPHLPKELDKVALPPRIVEPPDEIEVVVR